MKKTVLLFVSVAMAATLWAQAPQAFKYQAVARDAGGQVIQNQNVSFLVSLLQGSSTGTIVYSEGQTATTNDFGLVSLEIGNGVPIIGDFATIDWGAGPYFMKVEMDENGGNNFTWMGTTQLMSVPYALYAKSSGNAAPSSKIEDQDGNTYIDVEETANDDMHRFYVGGSEKMKFDGKRLEFIDYNQNTFLGENAGGSDPNLYQTNVQNVFVGYKSGYSNEWGEQNTFAGFESGFNNNFGVGNTFLGYKSGRSNISGSANTAIGYFSGEQNEGHNNVFIGAYSGKYQLTGSENTFLGTASGQNNNSSRNVFLGVFAGNDNLDGAENVFIGYSAGYSEPGSNKLYIENSNAGKDDALIYGEFDNDILALNGKIGIGNTSPGYDLDVNGDLNFTGSLLHNGVPFSATGLWSTNTNGIHFNSGNVGIGTDVPETGLHLDNEDLRLTGGQIDFGDQARVIKYTAGDYMSVQSPGAVTMVIDDNNNNTNMAFSVRKDDFDPEVATELFRVQENGRVGIGTDNPQRTLHIYGGDAQIEAPDWCDLTIRTYNPGTDASLFLRTATDGVWANDNYWAIYNDVSANNKLHFQFNTEKKMTISKEGNVGVGTMNPDGSAILDASSTSKGFLPPRMNSTQIANIQNPANGLTVFNTSDRHVYVFNTTDWQWKQLAYDIQTITPNFVCGNPLIDTRDAQIYNTVQIGTQCWMAENLNIGSMINGANNQANNGIIEKYCYNNNSGNCDTYGGLYQWNEMMQYVTTPGVKGICPDGWHLPTDAEWCTLEQFVDPTITCSSLDWRGTDGGGKLKEAGTTHWASPNTGATNSSGFTALPSGGRTISGSFSSLYQSGSWWSSTEDYNVAYERGVYYNKATIYRWGINETLGLGVRCIKN